MGWLMAAKAVGAALQAGAGKDAPITPAKAGVSPAGPAPVSPALPQAAPQGILFNPQMQPYHPPVMPPGLLGLRDPNGPATPSLTTPMPDPQFKGVPSVVPDAAPESMWNRKKVTGLLGSMFSGASSAY